MPEKLVYEFLLPTFFVSTNCFLDPWEIPAIPKCLGRMLWRIQCTRYNILRVAGYTVPMKGHWAKGLAAWEEIHSCRSNQKQKPYQKCALPLPRIFSLKDNEENMGWVLVRGQWTSSGSECAFFSAQRNTFTGKKVGRARGKNSVNAKLYKIVGRTN